MCVSISQSKVARVVSSQQKLIFRTKRIFSGESVDRSANGAPNGNANGSHLNFSLKEKVPRSNIIGPSILLNQNVRNLDMSATVGINEICSRMRENNEPVHHMGFGQSPFPVPEFMVEQLREYAGRKEYLPVRGLPQLREAVATLNRDLLGIDVSGDDVIITPGSKEALFLLQLVYYGELLLPAPSWVSYHPQAQIIGRPVQWVPTSIESDWKIRPKDFLEILEYDSHRPRVLILNSPSNPTGVMYSGEELSVLADICREQNILVISDEIYSPLHHESQSPPVSIAQYYPEGTIITNGVSKWAGSGGWRLGVCIFPKNLRWLLDAVAVVASETFTCAAAPIQYGALGAFTQFHSPEMQQYLTAKRRVLHGLSNYCVDTLRECGASVVRPQGGFYAFPDFSTVDNIERLSERWAKKTGRNASQFGSKDLTYFLLAEAGVAALGGAYFGRPERELTMRLSYTDFDGSKVLQSGSDLPVDARSSEMRDYLEVYCPRVMDSCRVLRDFMASL